MRAIEQVSENVDRTFVLTKRSPGTARRNTFAVAAR